MMRTAAILLSAILGFWFVQSGAAAAPAISVYWNQMNLSLNNCVRLASAALTEAGFANLQNQSPFIGATHDEYAATIFCGTEKGLIALLVAGPDRAVSGAFVTSIGSRLQNRGR